MEKTSNAPGSQKSAGTLKVKKKHRVKEIFLGFLILVVAVMVTPAVLSLFLRDIPPVSAPDLMPAKVNVPVAENAYYDLMKLEQAAVDVPALTVQQGFLKGVLAGTRWDQTIVDDAITKNAAAFVFFLDAAKKPKYQNPDDADPFTLDVTKFQSFQGWLAVSRTAALSAINLQKQDKEQEAFERAFEIVKVGTMVQRSQSPLVGFLVGTNMKILGLQTLQALLTGTKLPAAALTPYIGAMDDLTTGLETVTNALKMEHAFRLAFINAADQQMKTAQGVLLQWEPAIRWRFWVPRSYYFQPNRIIANMTAFDREQLAASSTPCVRDVAEQTSPTQQPSNWLKLYFLPNAIGLLMEDVIGPPYGISVRRRQCDEQVVLWATQTLLALKAFSQDKGSLPATLAGLVPDYLASVPKDPYDGNELKYSSEKKILYSVGSDHVDNGGSTGDDWTKMDDPTFTIR